ncbi:CaiB/BaiF CoA transferase family protein [Sedimenticola thiotaurini]|uniref:CoA-transferase n=1 Tax=Sedimenticola thiotaurini TaxID=1543721 RepID=A0A0F7K0N1_9GAMM|nr:CaiB/BaiF CoA-transferase family protein [Sedimenticola thiotaurini]AKH20720.1 CoA-transferase [Sedimenticola thiotaurini]
MGPLKGIRVLDLSRVLAGPWATQLLADYGATVWKIERPEVGDDTRHWGPPFLKDGQGADTSESAYYLSANRGKKSVAVDITTPSGQAIIRQLASRADVLVENFKLGGLKKYGLDYASLSAEHPGLIYCSITGFGQTGPDAGLAGYDAMVQARGGLMSITGERDDLPGGGPQKVGVAVVDLMTGMYAVSAILAALHHRDRSGEGQYIDLALLDTQVAWLANQGMNYLVSGEAPGRQGTAHPNIVPYQAMPTRDGFLMLAVGNDRQFAACCKVLGQAELARDDRFATNRQRVKHRQQLIPLLESLFRKKTTTEWRRLLDAEQVPCGPINSIDQVFQDPQVLARGMRLDLPHPLAGQVPQVANPVKFSRTPVEYPGAPPLLGADTEAVLNWLLEE